MVVGAVVGGGGGGGGGGVVMVWWWWCESVGGAPLMSWRALTKKG